ncbi:pimeloyl-ACP methyl ester carboxylesterase [Saccharothrix tamanrassetensis]|uniref:Pimeloyl-ACP methyl ester carboxylesterase n=1 Tax=Saccharothrix tamanrassetensis TaxID=1051531 RepID=A0A841CR64_9PSEU|nr:alpha/beta hydrolase [Saccharothrix tamanrassetensis]MBB5959383.1 pimeloyl-ACP methyl ester carboxylesterase [Saccharothrix tamanrassetensis]
MKTGTFASPEARERYFAAYRLAMALCPAPDEVSDVPTSFGTTRVYRFGHGVPLVLLPGLSATSAGWGAELGRYARDNAVYAVDTLGEPGHSVQTAPIRNAVDRGRWLDEVLAGLGLDLAHLVGASSGGWHVCAAAVHAPERIASISLIDPTGVTVGFGFGVVWRAALASLIRRDRAWRWFLRWAGGLDPERPDVRLVLAGIREYRAHLPPQLPFGEALREVRVPTLALFGGRNVVHDGVKAADRMRELVPHAEVELWPESGHRLDATEHVLAFVRR